MSRSPSLLLVGLLALLPLTALGQEAADPTLRGQLLLGDLPPDSGTVVLHRVTPEEAGEVDSSTVDSEGQFSLQLPHLPVPGSGEIFFASTRYEGILYFGHPITDPVHLDSIYTIQAYRSRTAPPDGVPFPVEIRNIFIQEGPMGWQITDLLEVRNDSTVTFVPGEEGGAVWRYPLPPEARTFRVGQGDLPPGSAEFADGVVTVSSPVPPGERLFIFQYEVDALDFSLPLPGLTERVEVLLEEPAPAVAIQGLARQGESIEMEAGSSYIRWTGIDLLDQTVRVGPGEEERASEVVVWFAVILALLLIAAGTLIVRRESSSPQSAAPRSRKAILVEIARLDEEHESRPEGDYEAAAQYHRRRAVLIRQLEELGDGSVSTAPR